MKRKNKNPTRAQREAMGQAPQLHKCNGCAFKGTKFALKEHREVTGHGV
jgi:hypothetical protein